ncbi:glycosyltransferase family 39 protein [Halanaerobium sp. MA284_MarDTE_T2]|uniref:ArnT family glycosyltransferase n=1 Tax=Halanaerobium sp. MA284_MarDTE_T2 TaxID=2183913 RepID=UPI000DF18EB7|nr:glycosyltransferase family 39 protein [Halanaerobium sp. MA284_MarDTE_T2]RCW45003.1 4-amino-4-deoxy-L-arabinose transferase-like glycosyltransferase [Halanaerobium sp. MA284_MarDTE_T2]
MDDKLLDYRTKKILIFLMIIIFVFILYFPSSIVRELHYRDEMRYVEVAREMKVNDSWLIPYFAGEVYTDKPPFYFIILKFMYSIFKTYQTWVFTLPGIFSSAVISIITFLMAKNKDFKNGIIAFLILISNILFCAMAVVVRMDMMMAALITVSLYCFYLAYFKNKGIRYYYGFFSFSAFAVWIKGPAGFLIPFVTVFAFYMLDKNNANWSKFPLLKGSITFIVILLLWLLPAFWIGGQEYMYKLLIVQTFGRAVDAFDHQQPFHYYFQLFPLSFLPWTFVLLTAVFKDLRNFRKIKGEKLFFYTWLLSPLILFSFFSSKLIIYTLPIIPAAALISAGYLTDNIVKVNKINTAVILSIAVYLPFIFIPGQIENFDLSSLLFGKIIIVLAVIILLIFYKNKKLSLSIFIIPFLFFIIFLNFSLGVLPSVSDNYAKKDIALKIKKLVEKGEVKDVLSFQFGESQSFAIYTDFFIEDIDGKKNINKYLERKGKLLLFAKKIEWQELTTEIKNKFSEIYEQNEYILLIEK